MLYKIKWNIGYVHTVGGFVIPKYICEKVLKKCGKMIKNEWHKSVPMTHKVPKYYTSMYQHSLGLQ